MLPQRGSQGVRKTSTITMICGLQRPRSIKRYSLPVVLNFYGRWAGEEQSGKHHLKRRNDNNGSGTQQVLEWHLWHGQDAKVTELFLVSISLWQNWFPYTLVHGSAKDLSTVSEDWPSWIKVHRYAQCHISRRSQNIRAWTFPFYVLFQNGNWSYSGLRGLNGFLFFHIYFLKVSHFL